MNAATEGESDNLPVAASPLISQRDEAVIVRSHSILIAEDDSLLSEMLAYNLEQAGYAILTAPAAAPAVTILRSAAAVDLLLTDIQMPGAMDGQALAKIARKLRPSLGIIYMSGRYGRLDEIDAVPDSIFLPKPFAVRAVLAHVERALADAAPVRRAGFLRRAARRAIEGWRARSFSAA